uniref:Uncharacterized protein n=1 Tax=Arundo donax TaxID=35708 RepID=A0A0A9AVF2_ARUDO
MHGPCRSFSSVFILLGFLFFTVLYFGLFFFLLLNIMTGSSPCWRKSL